jgi:hypothetical protein
MNNRTIHLLAMLLITTVAAAQDFSWATLIDTPTANEVAALDTDDEGNVYLTGVYGADQFVPYNGTAYLNKTSPDGTPIWSKTLGADLIVGDMVCVDGQVIIVLQSTGDVTLEGETILESTDLTAMAIVVFDEDGALEGATAYPDYHGQYANLATDGETVALHCRGAFNQGENVIRLSPQGVELASYELEIEGSINDIAYYDGRVYLSGHTNLGDEIAINDVFIPAGELDGLTFILGFNTDFVAMWGHADDALNAQDGRVVADESGVYSYQSQLAPDFVITNRMWKLNYDGELVAEVVVPTFSNNTLNPDLAISDCHVLLFVSNSFDYNNHELIIFDHELAVLDQKSVIGTSTAYSGQVATHENQIYISHTHMDNLDFNGEVEIIDLMDDAILYPYLARVSVGEDCGPANSGDCFIGEFFYEYQDCDNGMFFIDVEFDYESVSEEFTVTGNGQSYGTHAYGEVFYTFGPFEIGSDNTYELIFTDTGIEGCSAFFTFEGSDCEIEECDIEDLEVLDIVCDSDSTYSMTFNAQITNAGNEFFDLWVNNVFVDYYAISDLPLTINDITPRTVEEDIIQICVNDVPECCAVIEYPNPDCGPNSLSEFELGFALYPNPVLDVLRIEPDKASQLLIQVVDVCGALVLERSLSASGQLDLSSLRPGLYQLILRNQAGALGLKQFVKQ